jgi:transketolase
MLLYALLHLSGYDLPLSQLQAFRQFHSQTPGHPEYGDTPGVETTTGPLGQGLGNAVGMALAEKMLAARYNRPGHALIDHHTYAFAGDGCLMEGISHEVCSLAGTLGLGKLIVLYDDNGISIDGRVAGWFTDDTAKRFEAYGWQVITSVDGHDPRAIRDAITTARADAARPSLILCRTVIGKGAPNKQGSEHVHGSPLGAAEVAAARAELAGSTRRFRYRPKSTRAGTADTRRGGRDRMAAAPGRLPCGVSGTRRANSSGACAASCRQASSVLQPITCAPASTRVRPSPAARHRRTRSRRWRRCCPNSPAARRTSPARTSRCGRRRAGVDAADASGNYIHYGVREFGMGAIMNGLALHGVCVHSAAPSWCSWSTCAMRCAWRR